MIDDVGLIEEFKSTNLFEPKLNWPKDEFDYRTYARWTCDLVIEQLKKNPNTPALDILWRMHTNMRNFLEMADDTDSRPITSTPPTEIFLAACDTIDELGLLFV